MTTILENDFYTDEYEYYEELFDPLASGGRRARRARGRKAKPQHTPKKSQQQIVAELADAEGYEGGFNTTYQPSRHEAEWLLESLRSFYDRELISDVLALVKGGKEANVYCCAADPAIGVDLLAAKVYRPQQFRAIRNDALYRQGRDVLTATGRAVKKTDHRIMRAIGKKTRFGTQVMQTSWLMHEYKTMEQLYQAGGTVPRPIAVNENAILMDYCGEAGWGAPTLNEVELDPNEAAALYQEVLNNVELMLQHNLIHGDLSAYNILYWAGQITIIDFPQATNSLTNHDAYAILERDIARVCEYFAQQGVQSEPVAITDDLWHRYVMPDDLDITDHELYKE
jgi:RIO kinase 1